MKRPVASLASLLMVTACAATDSAATTTRLPLDATTTSVSTTTAVLFPTVVEGRLPDGRGYRVSVDPGLESVEPDGIFAAIVIDLDHVEPKVVFDGVECASPCTPVLGFIRFFQRSGHPTTYDDGSYSFQASSGDWTMNIAVYSHIVEAWGVDIGDMLLESIQPIDVDGGLPAFELSGPLRWATDDEIPLQMEVSYPSLVVRRGCEQLSVACSVSGSVQVIPADAVLVPAPPWDHSRQVLVSDTPTKTVDSESWELVGQVPVTVTSGAIVEATDTGIVVAGSESTSVIGFDGSIAEGEPPPVTPQPGCCGSVVGIPVGDRLVLMDAYQTGTWVLDPGTVTWSSLDDRPRIGEILGTAVIRDVLYVVAAAARAGGAVSHVSALDLTFGTWTDVELVPTGVSVGGATTDGERLIVAGVLQDTNNRIIGESSMPAAYEYGIDGWRSLPDIPIDGQASTVVWVEGAGLLAWN